MRGYLRAISAAVSPALVASSLVLAAGTATAAGPLGTPSAAAPAGGVGAADAEPRPLLADAQPVTPEVHEVALAPVADGDRSAYGLDGGSGPTGDTAVAGASEVGSEVAVVGVTWPRDGGEAGTVELRSRDGRQWSAWQVVEADEAVTTEDVSGQPAPERVGTEPVAVLEADEVQVRITGEQTPAGARLTVWDPGESPADHQATLRAGEQPAGVAGADGGAPTVYTRADWGANESWRTWRPRVGEVKGIVVHHTAGTNNYSRAQVPGIIRGIYAYHANTLDWGDIGYNVMVDRYGRAWEGRYGGLERAVIAGHARAHNSVTFGISVLGNFEVTGAYVPEAAFDAVARVSAWKLTEHGVRADSSYQFEGRANPAIQGHSDVSSTACPGKNFYPRLGELEDRILAYQGNLRHGSIRLSGQDRYATAADISRASFGPDVEAVVVASGADFPDALAGGPAAARLGAPLLLVKPTAVPGAVAAELRRLRPDHVYVLGGDTVVSDQVRKELAALTGAPVTQLAGADRYETAADVAELWGGDADTVFLASGRSFADALTGGPAAARTSSPLLLTKPGELPRPTLEALTETSPGEVVILGGDKAVDPDVEAALALVLPDAEITRHAGHNRYTTAAEVATAYWPERPLPSGVGGRPWSATVLAIGDDYPDALAGTQYGAVYDAPVLLARTGCMPAATAAEAQRMASTHRVLLGGRTALQDRVVERVC